MLEQFGDITMIQEVLQQAQTGLWIIEIEEGKEPRMYADKAMLGLLGLEEEPEPEVCYRAWYDRIIPEYYPQVEKGVEQMMRHRRAEVQYPWKHPKWGRIYVRCGGVRDDSYEDGVRLRGYHQNITDTIRAEQESDAVIRALSERYKGIYLCNMETEEIKTIKDYQEIGGYVKECSSLQEFCACMPPGVCCRSTESIFWSWHRETDCWSGWPVRAAGWSTSTVWRQVTGDRSFSFLFPCPAGKALSS
ncbi:MAG: hypothetical protein ACLRMZ_16275 [Blautia marasmi]